MNFTLKKRIVTKGDKKYTNFYLVLENGRPIPISVNVIKDEDGNVVNRNDFAILSALAVTD